MSHWSRVVVGVDGSPSALNAVRYGAGEASRSGAPLILLHVMPGPSPTLAAVDPLYPLDRADLRQVGHGILDEAADVASAYPDVKVERRLLDGNRTRVLQEQAPAGSLLVLGDQRLALSERLITGSVLHAAASRAAGSVVIVPQDWPHGAPHGLVTVGVANIAHSGGLLWRAFQTAHERRAELRILHAWEFRIRYGHLRVEAEDIDGRRAEFGTSLERELEACRADFPDVRAWIDVIDSQPAKALADASGSADVLVLARRASALSRSHLGATGRAVLHASRCPVQIVPPSADPVWERNCDVEAGGDLLLT